VFDPCAHRETLSRHGHEKDALEPLGNRRESKLRRGCHDTAQPWLGERPERVEAGTSPEEATTPGRAEDAMQQVTAPFLWPRSRRGFCSADAGGAGAAAPVSDMAARDR
jgi:hypothetical protein